MKKFKILLLILVSIFLISCGGSKNKMSDEDFIKYDELANIAITNIIEKKTNEFIELTDKSLSLTEKDMEELYNLLSEYGEFKEFGDSEGIYLEDANTKETYNTILKKVKYDKKELLFTVNFTQEDELVGIFFK